MKCYFDRFSTPIGDVFAAVNESGALIRMDFLRYKDHGKIEADMQRKGIEMTKDAGRLAHVRKQVEEYFAGKRTEFDLKLELIGTEFERRVWAELQQIPFGVTTSYGKLAAKVGNPKASRAVGLANGRNPVSLIVPCHRVIGANGALTGYGGGLPIKEALLNLEREHSGSDAPPLFKPIAAVARA